MGKEQKTSPEGRKCLFPHCSRTLSIYNHKEYCHIHLDQVIQRKKPVEIKFPPLCPVK